MVVDTRSSTQPADAADAEARGVERTDCCVVGGGPGGMVLALLLARWGVRVTLLEEHGDFERDFRGDTIHPSTMELMDELGLADRVLQLRHTKIQRLTLVSPGGAFTIGSFDRLKTKFPYITFMPQADFLEFLAAEARRYPGFRLRMGANVQQLVEEGGVVRGVRYRTRDGWHEVRAALTVGADGRFSRVRRLAGFEPVKTSPPMDVLWFRLPRRPGDPADAAARIAEGHMLVMLNRFDYWQVAYVIAKGTYREVHDAGLEALRRTLAGLEPLFADRVEALQDWKQVSLLSVESSHLERWYRPGLLLIGDAAHVMSPVGGVGINYAIQDAVVAHNVLAEPFLRGRIGLRHLAAVQRQRAWPTRIMQTFQGFVQQRIVASAIDPTRPFTLPAFLRLPVLRDLPARLIAFGVWPVHLDRSES